MIKKLLASGLFILAILFSFSLNAQNYSWAYAIGGSSTDAANDVAVDASGNVFVAGNFANSNVDFDPSASSVLLNSSGGYDAFFVKYNSSGTCLWAKNFSGGPYDDSAYDIEIDPSGNVYVAGYFQAPVFDLDAGAGVATFTNKGQSDIFLVKYDTDGNFIWANAIGGNNFDNFGDMSFDASGNVYISGNFSSTTIDLDPGAGVTSYSNSGANDGFVAKYDAANGSHLWSFTINNGQYIHHRGIQVEGTNVYVAGVFSGTLDLDPSASVTTFTSNGNRDFFIAKYNTSGVFQQAMNIGGAGDENVSDIEKDASGNIVVTGIFGGSVDFDFGGGTTTLNSAGNSDIYIAKYNSSLVLSWAKSIGGSSDDGDDAKLDVDGSDNVYIGGTFYSSNADFDPSGSTATLATNGSADVYFAKYDQNGVYVFAKSIGGIGDDYGYSCAVSSGGVLYSVGVFDNVNVDFDPGASTANLSSSGYDIFIAKYTSSVMQNQTITFPAISDKVVGDVSFTLNATASSSLTVSYSSSNASVATVSGNTVTIVGQGVTTITASQSGNGTYNAAPSVTQTFTVNPNSIEELNTHAMDIYPNPSNGIIYFKKQIKTTDTIELISQSGTVVSAIEIDINSNSIGTKNISSGIYFLRITNKNETYISKLIIE